MSRATPRSLLVAALLAVGLVACASGERSAGPDAQAAPVRRQVEGTVSRVLVAATGEPIGLLVGDVVVRVPRGALVAGRVAVGDFVRVEGEPVDVGAFHEILRPRVVKGPVVVVDTDASDGRVTVDDVARSSLPPMTVKGAIVAPLFDANQRLMGLVLTEGVSARFPAGLGLERLGLKPGDVVTMSGRGETYGGERGLAAETITLPNGETRVLDTPPPLLSQVSRRGEVARTLLDPHGEIDTLLFTDGTVVHLPALDVAQAAKLATGATLVVTGEGTPIYVRAATVTCADGTPLVSSTMRRRPSFERAGQLTAVEDVSKVARIIRAPHGEPEMMTLDDGAVVYLPPHLAQAAGGALQEGVSATVSGKGGRYPTGVSFWATKLTLGPGQSFSIDDSLVPTM